MKKKLLLGLIFIIVLKIGNAQYYSTGQDRATIIWREIETNNFQLVYPSYFEKEAQRVANLLGTLYTCNKHSLNVSPKKVSILLHTETAKSNGYFAWAPRRGELYTTPPDAGLPTDWLEHLATHEYRHVVQMDKFNEALPNILTIIFGEQVVPAVLSYKVPMWFMEGDAVLTETLMSSSGRGRSPDFLQVMKAYLLEQKDWFDYDKAALGSYKDFVPNIYELGYPMVANTRKNYGSRVWNEALNLAGKKPYPWSNFLQHITDKQRENVCQKLVRELDSIAEKEKTQGAAGLKIKDRWHKNKHRNHIVTLYNDNMTELQARWSQQQTYFDTTQYRVLSPPKQSYTNYSSPQIMPDGSVLALKSGYDDYERIIRLKEGREEEVYTTGKITSGLCAAGDFLFWTENIPSIRWEEQSKNAIFFWDLKSKKKRKISIDKSLYMPSVDSTCSLVVGVVKNEDFTNAVVVIERTSGRVLFHHSVGTTSVTDPQFIENEKIAYIFTKNGTGIASISMKTNAEELLINPHNVPLRDLAYAKGQLYFTAGYEGKNDIYSYNISSTEIQKITETPYGAKRVAVSADSIVYMNYTNKGYEIVSMPISEGVLQKIEPTEWEDDFLLKAIKKQEKCKGGITPTDTVFPSKYYRKRDHLFNFHSRSPFAASSSVGRGYDLGISTTSQNLLSTMFINVGYRQKRSYKNGQAYANLVYKGWFPVISTELSYGKQSKQLLQILEKNKEIDTARLKEEKKRWKWDTEVALPFNISRGKYARHISLAAGIELTRDVDVSHTYLEGTNANSPFSEGDALNLSKEKTHELFKYSLYFANLHKKSYRDIYTPFGQQMFFTYKHTPFDDRNIYTYAAEGVFYFPSFFKHHGIKVYGGYQYQPKYSEFFKDNVLHPRGTVSLLSKHKYSLQTTYKFPLAYPDWHLGRIFYVKRIKTALFYDYSLGRIENFSEHTYAYGAEFTFDTHLIQIPLPIEFGMRVGYETQHSESFFNLLLSLAF